MPAGSEPLTLPHTWRPLGPRIAGALVGSLLLAVCAFAWFGWNDDVRASFTFLQRITLVALGLLGYAVLYGLVRSRVVAEPDRLVVVNGYRRHEYDWAEVVSVNLPPGAPWVTLDLADGTTVSALGIQSSDGARANAAVRHLRRLVADVSGGRA